MKSAVKTQEKRDYYEVLGVARDASGDAIREAFIDLSRRFHPDVSTEPDADSRFREASEAYEVLSQPDSRLLYDRLAYRGPGNRGFGPAHPGVGKPTADSIDVSDEELLDWIFTGRRVRRPREIVGELRLGSVEAERGTKRTVRIRAGGACSRCGGRGRVVGANAPECTACGGEGRRKRTSVEPDRKLLRVERCPECEGAGRLALEQCPECRGAGHLDARRDVVVYVPPGVRDGQELVVARLDAGNGTPRNACVVLRVPRRPRGERVVQLVAGAALVVTLGVIALVIVST